MAKISNITEIIDLLDKMHGIACEMYAWQEEKERFINEAPLYQIAHHEVSETTKICDDAIALLLKQYKLLMQEHPRTVRAFENNRTTPIDFERKDKTPYFLNSAHNYEMDREREQDFCSETHLPYPDASELLPDLQSVIINSVNNSKAA